jgi:hypothetical protein
MSTIGTMFESGAVLGTDNDDRDRFPNDFVLVVDPEVARAAQLGATDGVVIERMVDAATRKVLRVSASLRIDAALSPRSPTRDGHAPSGPQVRMDQTLRTALGIPYAEGAVKGPLSGISLARLPIDKRSRWKAWWLRLLGVKYAFARVEKPYPTDIEKGICRISKDTLSIIGTDEGRRVVVVACRRNADQPDVFETSEYATRAYDLSKDMREARAARTPEEVALGWRARYVDAPRLLGVNPDLSPIYLDQHARDALGVNPGDAVRVRRDFVDLYMSQAFEFGVVTGLSAPVGRLLPDEWRANSFGLWLVLSLLLSGTIALGVVVVRLRARVARKW